MSSADTEAARPMQTLYGIQYLRAFAALAVVIFHAAERTGQHFAIGAAGVDVFFVVSGFIMMTINDRRPTRPLPFLRDRILRIAPSYWLVTGIMIAGAAVGLFPNLELSPTHILGSFLFLPVSSPSTGQFWPVLVQGWTLNYEIFFYTLFALVLLVRPAVRLPLLTALLTFFVIAGFLLPDRSSMIGFYTEPLILEFAAGAALAKLWKHGRLPSPFVGLFLIVLSLAGFSAIHLLKLEFDALSCGPLAALLVLGVLTVETGGKLPHLPGLGYVGDASYSIYLWHTLALSVVTKGGTILALPPLATAMLGIAAGMLIGLIAYECVERPLHTAIKGRWQNLPRLRRHERTPRTARSPARGG